MSKNFLSILRNYFIIIYIFIIIICIFFIPFFNNTTITTTSISENTNYQITISNGFCWPIPGYTRISSYFGYRKAPTVGATSFHGGIDIPAPSGTNLISAITGKVTKTGFMGSGGCSVVIQNDTYTVIFHHVSPNYLVKAGDSVTQGQIIAQVGPKNVYGFTNNIYKDSNRQPNKWRNYRFSFAFYYKKRNNIH